MRAARPLPPLCTASLSSLVSFTLVLLLSPKPEDLGPLTLLCPCTVWALMLADTRHSPTPPAPHHLCEPRLIPAGTLALSCPEGTPHEGQSQKMAKPRVSRGPLPVPLGCTLSTQANANVPTEGSGQTPAHTSDPWVTAPPKLAPSPLPRPGGGGCVLQGSVRGRESTHTPSCDPNTVAPASQQPQDDRGLPQALLLFLLIYNQWGCPGGTNGKEPTCHNARNVRDMGSIPGLGRYLEKGMATHSRILAGESHGQRNLATILGVAKSQTRLKRLSTAQYITYIHSVRNFKLPGPPEPWGQVPSQGSVSAHSLSQSLGLTLTPVSKRLSSVSPTGKPPQAPSPRLQASPTLHRKPQTFLPGLLQVGTACHVQLQPKWTLSHAFCVQTLWFQLTRCVNKRKPKVFLGFFSLTPRGGEGDQAAQLHGDLSSLDSRPREANKHQALLSDPPQSASSSKVASSWEVLRPAHLLLLLPTFTLTVL